MFISKMGVFDLTMGVCQAATRSVKCLLGEMGWLAGGMYKKAEAVNDWKIFIYVMKINLLKILYPCHALPLSPKQDNNGGSGHVGNREKFNKTSCTTKQKHVDRLHEGRRVFGG